MDSVSIFACCNLVFEEMSSRENVYRRVSSFGRLLAECQTQVRF